MTYAECDARPNRVEDAEDAAAIDRLDARIEREGFAVATAAYLRIGLMERRAASEQAVRVWRGHRGLTRKALAMAAGVSPSYLTELETRLKRGGLAAMNKTRRGAARLARRHRCIADTGGLKLEADELPLRRSQNPDMGAAQAPSPSGCAAKWIKERPR